MALDKVAFSLPVQCFSSSGNVKAGRPKCFSAVPVCLEFQRLLKQKNSDSIVPGVSNRDLLNIVVALYDVCLPDIGLEDLQANVYARGAKTIILVRDEQEVLEEYRQRVSSDRDKDRADPSGDHPTGEEEEDERPGMFSFVFSDSESSDEEEDETESDGEEDEHFSAGLKDFLVRVKARGRQRRLLQDSRGAVSPMDIGIESRIVAAMTYQRTALNSKEKVIQLSLISTRKRYRGYGVGQHIVKMLQDPSLVGLYDAIVTHADSGAVKFFSRCGFSDDVLLNSKFREFEDDWTNTTMMSYFPPFTTGAHCSLDATDIELEMELWKMRSLVAYQAQTVFMTKIIHEIRTLRKQLASQKDQIRSLTNELEETKDEKFQLEKRFLQYKLEKTQQFLESTNLSKESLLPDEQSQFETSCQNTELEEEECRAQTLGLEDQADQATIMNKINSDFIEKMRGYPGMEDCQIAVEGLAKASLPADVKESMELHVSALAEPTLWTRLYYCGGLDRPERLLQILCSGFSPQDLQPGAYGNGLYFSSSASTACKFSAPDQVLVADVHIGNTETVLHKDKKSHVMFFQEHVLWTHSNGQKWSGRTFRRCASKGFDSILVPGRLHETSSTQQSNSAQEFIIFSHLQATPVCLLTYSIER
ncbi:uncharacterized protein [Ambystoma mexicanum]|uniref:uncharacterized protein n=1 Tax=Ambystoma mexicanum TaxID=8296 RepID=UPI0037E77C88